ncbi:MAG: peptidoglycan-binding protein [Bdellovibrionota bacterium]
MKTKTIFFALAVTGFSATPAIANVPGVASPGAAASSSTPPAAPTTPSGATPGTAAPQVGSGATMGTAAPSAGTPVQQVPGTNPIPGAGSVTGSITNAPTTGSTPDTAKLSGTALSPQQVMDAQRALIAGGYSVTADGVAGPQTQTALRSFQSAHGLPVTGQLDANTLDIIKSGKNVSDTSKATETPPTF